MSNDEDDDFIYCKKCEENGRTGTQRRRIRKKDLEEDQWNDWICERCDDKEIGLRLIDFIKTRIQVTEPEDNRSRFIFRELLQNADDVKANMLVLRFEEDALYVANDGRAFTTGRGGDFAKISQVLGRHQAEDKEVVGHFGSGFQTVYAITNSPEVHSSGRSGRMNPYTNKWDYDFAGLFKKRDSPYLHKASKGVLFRFPWRDDTRAREEIRGEKVWEDRTYWPRWSKRERRELFEDLKEYVHPALLCCQHLTAIRLIWHEKCPPPEKDLYEGFQVIRDFCLRTRDTETSEMRWFKGSVKQGAIEPGKWKDERKWEDGFQLEGWHWQKDTRSFDYLIGEKNVSEKGTRIFLGKKADSSVTITSDLGALERELKRGDLFAVFPLFDITSVFQRADGRAYLYSVIPLSMRGKNKFIFSAHFWPAEDRKDVDVEGPNGIFGEWYRYVMLNVVELYEWLFDEFLNQIHTVEMPEEVRQRIILDSVPGAPLSEWMRPGKENRVEWSQRSQERFNELVASLVEKPILFSKNEWIRPTVAYWAHDEEEQAVFETMGHRVFTSSFVGHPHFKTLSEKLKNREIDEAQFKNRWHEFVQANKDDLGNLVYGQNLETGETLNKEAVSSLITFCITGKHASFGTMLRPVVPGRDGVLRRLDEYPVLPAQLEFLSDVLPGSKVIHDDFAFGDLALVHKKEVKACGGDQVIYLIDEVIRKDPKRFGNLSHRDHAAMSKTLQILVEEIGWAPRDAVKDCRFIPYREGTKVSLGTLNVKRLPGRTEWISRQSTKGHVAREYERDSIFGVQTVKVPGLTLEVEAKIKFLSLLECDDKTMEKVEDTLDLVRLMEDVPSNFVRHFLSPQHKSLFVDSVLEDFLGISDKSRLINQKEQFQEALKTYFKEEIRGETHLTRRDMGKVPCLYDEQRKWSNAEDFAQSIDPTLKMLGYKALHEDLKKWSPETLYALGVDYSPQSSKVIESIKKFAMEKEKHRTDLGNIILWLLTSEVSIEPEFEDVKHLLWVPTMDGGFRCPGEVLLPNSRNKRILGDDFGGFLDTSSFRDKMTDDDVTWQKFRKRAQPIGLKDAPDFSDMVSVVERRRKSGTAPPSELFDALSKEVGEDERKTHDLFGMKKFGYYLNGKWMDSRQIRVMDADSVPKEVRSTLETLPPRHRHSHYLIADGSWDRLFPEDILQPLLDRRVVPSLSIWDDLRKLASSFNEEHEELYGGTAIYPVDEHQVSPKDIICIESDRDDAFLKEGVVGKLYVLGRELTQRHGEVLIKLGARRGSELGRSDTLDLIRLQKGEEATLHIDKVPSILRLIRRTIALDSGSSFPDESLWPAEKGGQVVLMKPRDCYVKDSQLSKYFEKDLSFLCIKIDGKEDQSLKKYAIESGCKSFSACLKKGEGIKIENCKEDSQGALFYKELANALGHYFSSLLTPVCFEWLNDVGVRRCDKIAVHYSTGEFKNVVDRAALINRYGSKWVISCDHQPPARVRDHLTEEITNTCIEQGFPESEREKLQIILLRLLTDKVNEWTYHVEDYKPSGLIPQEYTIFKSAGEEPEPIFHFQTLKEVDALNRLEMNESGYADTKNTLQSWYHACQICGNRTPADESGYTTSETLKRVVCRRGGRYKGETSGFSTDNSVYLCPTHQVLWVRELVRFSELEHARAQKPSERVIRELQKRIKEFEKQASENPQKSIPWECGVFEGKSKSETGPVKGKWVERKIEFRAEHLVGFLNTLLEYLENRERALS